MVFAIHREFFMQRREFLSSAALAAGPVLLGRRQLFAAEQHTDERIFA